MKKKKLEQQIYLINYDKVHIDKPNNQMNPNMLFIIL